MVDLKTIYEIIRRRFWLILLIPLAAVIITFFIDSRATPTYQTSVRLLISADTTFLEGRDLINGYTSLDRASIVANFVEIANSRRIFVDTLTELGLVDGTKDLYRISTVALPSTSVLEMSVTGPDPENVQRMADTAAENFTAFVAENFDGYAIETLDAAYLPQVPVEPNIPRDMAVALVLGLMIGGFLAAADYFLINGIAQIRQWDEVDSASLAFTKQYFDQRAAKMLEPGFGGGSLAIIRLHELEGLKKGMSRRRYHEILRDAVARMRSELRGKDIIARWNGTSFIVVLPSISTEEAFVLLDAVQNALEQPRVVEKAGQSIAFYPRISIIDLKEGGSISTLIQNAETALDASRLNGSKPVIATPELRKSAL